MSKKKFELNVGADVIEDDVIVEKSDDFKEVITDDPKKIEDEIDKINHIDGGFKNFLKNMIKIGSNVKINIGSIKAKRKINKVLGKKGIIDGERPTKKRKVVIKETK